VRSDAIILSLLFKHHSGHVVEGLRLLSYKWLIKELKAKSFTQKKEKGRINQEIIS